ncbi:PAS domain S-box protein [bacterium]|nr:PAS domain S-box protein [bacterium]
MSSNSSTGFSLFARIGFIALFITVFTGGVWFFKVQEYEQRQVVETRLMDVAHLKSRQIADWLQDQMIDAALISQYPAFIREMARLSANPKSMPDESFRTLLYSLKKQHDYYDILVVDSKKRLRFKLSNTYFMSDILIDICSEVKHRDKPIFIDLHMHPEFQLPHISVAAPVIDHQNGIDKCVGIFIFINAADEFLYPIIRNWPTPSKTAETYLIRKEGDDVVFLNELRYRKDSALKFRIPISQADFPAARAAQGKTGIMICKDYRGTDVIASVLHVQNSAWYLVSKIDISEAFADWRTRSLLITAMMAGALGSIVAAGLVIRQRYLKMHYRELYQSESALRESMEKYAVTLNAIGDAVISTDARGQIEFMNPVSEDLTGWSQKDARGKQLNEVFKIVDEDTREVVESPVERVIKEGAMVNLADHTLLIAKDGREIPISDSGALIREENQGITGVVLVFRDQTEERLSRRLTNTRLKLIEFATHHTLDELLTEALDLVGAFVDSPIGFYHFVDSDQKTVALQQWSSKTVEEFCRIEGRGMNYHIDQAGIWVDCLHQKKPVIHNDYESLSDKKGLPDGHAKIIRELVVPVLREGKVVAILGVGNKSKNYTEKDAEVVSFFADLTWIIVSQKRAEEALRESMQKYYSLFNQLADGVFLHDIQGNIIDINQAAISQSGYSKSELQRMQVFDLHVDQSEREDIISQWRQWPLEKPVILEAIHRCKNGSTIPVEIKTGKVQFGQQELMLAIVRDITERKKAEEAICDHERELALIVNNIPGLVARVDRNLHYLYASEGYRRVFGMDPKKVVGSGLQDVLDEESYRRVEPYVRRVLKGEQVTFESPVAMPNGEMNYGLVTFIPDKDINGNVRGFFVIGLDISKRKQAEDQVRNDLKEKEILLRELYHRTKNNMQVISSMLRLRAHSLHNEKMQGIFKEIENKIQAMAFVHKKLYESNDLSSLNLKPYFNDLILLIQQSYLLNNDRIKLIYHATDVPVLIDTAIPLGLVLNELMTNAVKHAFPEGKEGKIYLSLKKKLTKEIMIEVRDTGVGLPKGFDIEKDIHLGLETVIDLIRNQLGGEVNFENQGGLCCRIKLKKELYQPRV